jgi:hypothetical protein
MLSNSYILFPDGALAALTCHDIYTQSGRRASEGQAARCRHSNSAKMDQPRPAAAPAPPYKRSDKENELRLSPAGNVYTWLIAAAALWALVVTFSPRGGGADRTASGWQGAAP